MAQFAVLRNAGTTDSLVTGNIPYTLNDGTKGSVSLPKVRLASDEVREVNLSALISGRNVGGHTITAAGLEFTYSSEPGSVVAAALSISQDGNQVFRVPLVDAASKPSSTGQYPWSLEDDSSTVVYVKNATNESQHFTIQVGFDGGAYALGLQSIEGGQTMLFDVSQLRDNQASDANGNKIPADAKGGQVHWSVQGPDSRALIGRVEQVDVSRAMSMTASCGICCPDSFSNSFITPGSVTGVAGGTTQFLGYRQDVDCNGNPSAPYIFNGFWTSDNTAVATVSGTTGLATAQGVGSTAIHNFYYGTVYVYVGELDNEHCDSNLVDCDASATCDVVPFITLNPFGSWNPDTTTTGGFSTISISVMSSNDVPQGTSVTLSFGSTASNGTAQLTATPADPPAENQFSFMIGPNSEKSITVKYTVNGFTGAPNVKAICTLTAPTGVMAIQSPQTSASELRIR